MQYGQFLEQMNDFITEQGIQVTDEIRNCAKLCSEALDRAISSKDPVVSDLHERMGRQRLWPEIQVNSQIAGFAHELFHSMLREKVAGENLVRYLNDSEKLTFDELLTAFKMFATDKDALAEFVSKRDYMRNISHGSPLRSLIDCILEKRDDYAEVLEREVHQSGHEVTHPSSDAVALMDKFVAVLQECMAEDSAVNS